MKVFISWSGDPSQRAAVALKELFKNALPYSRPWISTQDMRLGLWSPQLVTAIQDSDLGIICLFSSNLRSPWIQFETGALFGTKGDDSIVPLLFDVSGSEMPSPMDQLQWVNASKQELRKLFEDIHTNTGLKTPMMSTVVRRFERSWPTAYGRFRRSIKLHHSQTEQLKSKAQEELSKLLESRIKSAINSSSKELTSISANPHERLVLDEMHLAILYLLGTSIHNKEDSFGLTLKLRGRIPNVYENRVKIKLRELHNAGYVSKLVAAYSRRDNYQIRDKGIQLLEKHNYFRRT